MQVCHMRRKSPHVLTLSSTCVERMRMWLDAFVDRVLHSAQEARKAEQDSRGKPKLTEQVRVSAYVLSRGFTFS
jgi:hypothetical protein